MVSEMPFLICPECGAQNDRTAESCQECSASLLDVLPSTQHPSEELQGDGLSAFSQDDQDLPELLNALKQDDNLQIDADDQGALSEMAEESDSEGAGFEAADQKNIPDWLMRIRERVSREKDSSGEITQKIKAARDRLEGGKDVEEHANYQLWIKRLRNQGVEEDAGKPKEADSLAEGQDAGEGDSDWLSKIMRAKGNPPDSEHDETDSISDREGDSLLQWLVSLEDKGKRPKPLLEGQTDAREEPPEDTLPTQISSEKNDPQVTRQINKGELRFEPPELSVSREEKAQADQLAGVIIDERASRPVRQPESRSSRGLVRLILGLILIAGLSLSLFAGGKTALPEDLLQPYNEALVRWMKALPADSSLLLIMDFTPGYAGELSMIAQPILEQVIRGDTIVFMMSSSVSGNLLAGRLLGQKMEEERVTDLGYFPISAYGAYGVASQTYSGESVLPVPELGRGYPLVDVDGVLLLSDSYEGARVWIEQLSSLMPETPLILLAAAQAGPLVLPYWESGQLMGLVAGISEAAGLERMLSEGDTVASRWRAYQTGILMLMALLVIGVIFNIDNKAAGSLRGEG